MCGNSFGEAFSPPTISGTVEMGHLNTFFSTAGSLNPGDTNTDSFKTCWYSKHSKIRTIKKKIVNNL